VLLNDTFPEFTLELERLLARAGAPELAAQAPGLVIVDRCRCEDGFCSSFYTQPKPQGTNGPGHNGIDLEADEGMVVCWMWWKARLPTSKF
jgi:hypothetical protein